MKTDVKQRLNRLAIAVGAKLRFRFSGIAHRHNVWKTWLFIFQLKDRPKSLWIAFKVDIKTFSRLYRTIFLTLTRSSLNLARRSSDGDFLNFRRTASLFFFVSCIIIPLIQGGEFRLLIFLVGMWLLNTLRKAFFHC